MSLSSDVAKAVMSPVTIRLLPLYVKAELSTNLPPEPTKATLPLVRFSTVISLVVIPLLNSAAPLNVDVAVTVRVSLEELPIAVSYTHLTLPTSDLV